MATSSRRLGDPNTVFPAIHAAPAGATGRPDGRVRFAPVVGGRRAEVIIPRHAPNRLVIRGGMLFDGGEAGPVENELLVIDGDRIVCRGGSCRAPAGAA